VCEAQVANGFITSFAACVRLHSKHNRQLLWHGSRITNFTGILSQGLRIAPPEAPVQGYMFGKGIYTAGTPQLYKVEAQYCTFHSPRKLFCHVAYQFQTWSPRALTTALPTRPTPSYACAHFRLHAVRGRD